MDDINLTQKLRQKMGGKSRVRGRYNSSEIYAINHGFGGSKLTPEQWMNPPERTAEELLKMWSGIGIHNQLEDLVGKENSEIKREFIYKDIILVAKVDYLPPHRPDEVWEWKTSDKLMKDAKPWHRHQVGLYLPIFDRPVGRIYQPIQDKDGLYLKHLGKVERDDKWFEEELKKLYLFHLDVENLWKGLK